MSFRLRLGSQGAKVFLGSKNRFNSRARFWRPILESLESRQLLTAVVSGVLDWVEEGPERIGAGSADANATRLFDQVGAAAAVAVHPTNPDVLYVAAVNGGIWKTENARYSRSDGVDNDGDGTFELADPDEVPTWRPLTDDWPNLSMGALAFDLMDPTYQTLYAGNARYSSLGEGVPRGGLLRTTDGGATWTEIGRTQLQNSDVRAIEARGSLLLVATSSGLWRSTNYGANWNVALAGNVTDVVDDPTHSQGYFAGVTGQGVFRSTNDGQTWTAVNSGVTGTAASAYVDLAVHSSGGGATNVVYAALSDAGHFTGVFRSTNSGGSWTSVGDVAAEKIETRPGFHHIAFAADPSDPEVVVVAGVVGSFFGDAGSGTWERISGANANNTGSHADHRFLAFDQDGDLLDLNDGGVYRLNGPHDPATRTYESINGNLHTTEVNDRSSLAYDHLNDILVVGTQDNGSAIQNVAGQPSFTDWTGGDGNTVAVEVDGSDVYRYLMANNYGWFQRRRYDDKNTLVQTNTVMLASPATPNDRLSGLTRGNDIKTGNTAAYTPGYPFVLNSVDPSRVLLGTWNGLYESADRGDTVSDITPGGVNRSVTAAAYGGRSGAVDNADLVFVGASGELWLRTTAGGAFSERTAYPGSAPWEIDLDPDDWRTAYVLDNSGAVWRGTSVGTAGEAWTSLTLGAGLPMLQSLEYQEVSGTPVLLAGAEGGVYRRIHPETGSNNASWYEFGRGLPNLDVMDLLYSPQDDVLFAGTAGRGIWSISSVGTSLAQDQTLSVRGDLTDLAVDGNYYEFPNRDDIIRLARNPLHSNKLDIFVNSVSGIPTYSIEFPTVLAIEIDARGGNDFIQIEFLPANTTLVVYGGGGRDVMYVSSGDVFSDITLYGDADPDWFVVTPTTHGNVDITVDGGAPAAPVAEGDELRIVTGSPILVVPGGEPDEGIVQVSGYQPIPFDRLENVTSGDVRWRTDRLEANDSFATAYNLVAGDQTHTHLSIHQSGNDDWYKWTASQNADLAVELFFQHELGDVDLALYDAGQTLLISSASVTDNEYLIYSVLGGQTYYIRVYGFAGAVNPNYSLEIDWPHGFPDDGYEPNDSFALPYNLPKGDQVILDLAVTPVSEFVSDEDWYGWTATATGILDVTIDFAHALGNIDLELRDASNAVLDSSNSTSDGEAVSAFVQGGLTYYVRVYGFAGATNPDYELSINGPEIVPDVFYGAGNNSPLKAADLKTGKQTHLGLSIHQPYESDWYLWRANATAPLTVGIEFEHDLGDLDLELLDLNLNQLALSAGVGDSEQVSYTVSSGLQYYIRVYGYGGATNFSYRLDLDWTQPIPEDAFEPNESYMAAPLLPYGNRTYEDLTIHAVGEFSSSEDWFGWTAPTEGLLDVSVQFLAALGDIDLGLYDAAGTLLSSSGSTAGNIERVTRSVQTGELYYIRVYGYNGARNAEYDLVVRGPEIAPDFLELNDSWETAMDLGMGGHAFESLTIHAPGNSDWYRWTSPANGVCAVDLAFNHVFGDIDVALLDENLVQLDISNGVGGTEQVSAALSAGQTVYVHVYGFAGTRSPGYSMVLAGPEIVPDILEPNDSLAGATVFGGGDVSVAGMSIHATGDSDWYRWIAPSSGVLDVTVLFTHAMGDVDLQLYDQNGSLLLASESVDDDEQLGYRVDAGASYYIRVYGVGTAQVPPVLMEPKLVVRAGTVNSAYELIIDGPDSGPTLGDMDFDGDVDFDDIDDFVLGLNDPSAYEMIYGVPPSVHGDTDQDGDQDFDDIDDFVDLLISSSSEDTAGVSAVDSVFTETETGPLLEARRPQRHDRERAAPRAAQPSYGLPSLFRQVQRQRLAERTAQRDDAFPVAGNGGRERFPDMAESEAIAGSGNRFHGRHTARRR